MSENKVYDVIIIGGGPGGYTAALYCVRAGLETLVLEKMMLPGGQMTQTMQIDNYPGVEDGIDGFTLGEKMKKSAERFGAKTKTAEVLSVKLDSKIKEIKTAKEIFFAKSVIIATGADHKHLGIEAEKKFIGRGVGYCAACDGMLYRGKTVAVVGGGNSAAADAQLLARVCKKVYLIHRRDTLRASKVYHQPLANTENIEFVWNTEVTDIIGDNKVQEITVKNRVTGCVSTLSLDGLFISVGRSPATSLFKDQLNLDENGYIIADETTRTNIPGVFAVGDARTKPFRQIVGATADGAVAAHFAEEYLMQK